MAASAATRAALLGLALLALQRSPAGALGDASPERGGRGGPSHSSTNRTHTEPQIHHTHHQQHGSAGHRGPSHLGSNHPAAAPSSHDLYRSPKKLHAPESFPERNVDEKTGEHLKKAPWIREETVSVASSNSHDSHKYNKNDGDSAAGYGAAAELASPVAASNYLGASGHSSTVINMPPRQGLNTLSNCSTCTMRDEIRNYSIQSIKEQILNKLGMKHAPNITGRAKPRIPPIHHLLDMYGMQNDQPDRVFQAGQMAHEEEDDFHAKTTMVIAVAQTTKLRHGGGMNTDMDIQHFRFSERSLQNRVSDASLFIYVPATSRAIRVLVYRVVGNATEHESMTVLQVAASKFTDHRKPGWVELNAYQLLIDWFRKPSANLGVVVKIEDELTRESRPYTVDYDFGGNEESKQPFVKVHTTDGRKYRSRRTIGLNCDETSQETRCCRYPLTVDFEEFGWDWIIAPKKYDANYCSGECPYVFLQKYPHTHIVQQANPSGTVGPCCAPRKLSPISMLYFDNEFNIIYGLLPGMVVDRCGCQ